MQSNIPETEQQVMNLAASVLSLSDQIKKIEGYVASIADGCTQLQKKIYLLERDFEDRRIMGFIKKALWGLYPVLVLALLFATNIEQEKVTALINAVKMTLQIEV